MELSNRTVLGTGGTGGIGLGIAEAFYRSGSRVIVCGRDPDRLSLVELTALFIGHLIKRPSAAIINVSSGLGFMPMLNMPIYCATKAAVHTYSLVLRQQLEDTPVKVVEIVPPMVDTDLNKEGRDRAHLKFRGISLSEYIPTVIEGLENDAEMVFHGDGEKMMTDPRGQSESRLLTPSW